MREFGITLVYSNNSGTHTLTHTSSYLMCPQNDTMRVIYMYHPTEPAHGSVVPGSLPDPQTAFRGYVPLSLMQRLANVPPQSSSLSGAQAQTGAVDGSSLWLELRHEDVELPAPDETRFWCRVFELNTFRKRHHLIRVC